MTNRYNKIKRMSSEEAYKYGIDKGFGDALGRCIRFLRMRGLDSLEDDLREFVLSKRGYKHHKREMRNESSNNGSTE